MMPLMALRTISGSSGHGKGMSRPWVFSMSYVSSSSLKPPSPPRASLSGRACFRSCFSCDSGTCGVQQTSLGS